VSGEAKKRIHNLFRDAGLPIPGDDYVDLVYQWDMTGYIKVEQVIAVLAAFGPWGVWDE
jgi:hypothetical protein